MKKLIFVTLLSITCAFNNNVLADNYVNLELSYINHSDDIDPMVIFTLGGLNMDIKQDIFEKATWEISYGIGSKTHQRITNESYYENQIFNLAINLPITNKTYAKVGFGGWWSHLNNVDGNTEDNIFTPVIKLGGGYMLNESIPINMNMHIGSNNLSLGVGYIF